MKRLLLVGVSILTIGVYQPISVDASNQELNVENEAGAISKGNIVDQLRDVKSDFKELMKKSISDGSKTWTINFNTEIDSETFNNESVYVVDGEGNKLTTKVTYIDESKEGVVYAPDTGYKKSVNYTLIVTEDVKTNKGVALSQGVTMKFELSGDDSEQSSKDIHDFSKEELEAWIDKEEDLTRLREYPVQNDMFNNDLKKTNDEFMSTPGNTEDVMNEYFLQPASGYMEAYYNRNYKIIGEQFKDEISYYFKSSHIHNDVFYAKENLKKMFEVFVQETREEKLNSESIFVTDLSMYYQAMDDLGFPSDRMRGTQYIKYKSGNVLPEGVELNKWYKRDVDVKLLNNAVNRNIITWETAVYAFDGILPLSSYEKVSK
ncbi:hypothetical protein GLW08_10475 [Pontibacillus yanchengensis]|uniref:Uncharacterized protein n=1 Tax=Pontibacillus yanchengensis TaxID=462910 RepID=A0ACC7VHW3_9BACI|nr:Ig-like domain-containing protein [Pontibacillus yanchengensis]MYL53761.1 hypothetical protein [Pontibacillus yanchengensis]